jgi:AGZA family xanthine/uracil permease-like MFS transporter
MPAAALTTASGLLRAPDVPLKIGDLHDPRVRLALVGFLLMVVLLLRRVRGALLVGMAATAAIGFALGHGQVPRAVTALPFAGDLSLAPLFLRLDIAGVLRLAFLPALLTLVIMGLLDTLGTLVGLGASGGLLDEKGRFPEIQKPMTVDALACVAAGLVGTTTSGAYIESATGIREGARTGLAAVTTAALFALSLFFIPFVEPLQRLHYVYAPALVAVGFLMTASARHVDFDDLTELVPALATIVMMAFTYNIGNGLTVGLLLHPLLKLAAGRVREVKAGGWALFALCLSYYVFGVSH